MFACKICFYLDVHHLLCLCYNQNKFIPVYNIMKQGDDMELISWDIFPEEVKAFTTTRNLGDLSFNNTNKDLILENRKRLANLINTSFDNMVAQKQTHSTNIMKVSIKDGGSGIESRESAFDDNDALYTKDKGLFLLSFHADCTPLLIYARDKRIVCAIHSGWMGTVNQITTKVIKKLVKEEGCNPESIYAYIGPCISKTNFEIQYDVVEKIRAMDFDTHPYYEQISPTHYIADNKGLNYQQLLNQGIPDSNITISTLCTVSDNNLFYSHRKGNEERNVSLIALI